MSTKTLAIMFTDIKGFTERVSRDSRDQVARLLVQHERLLLPVFRYYKGIVAKTIGDAFLVHFESPTDSVLCGLTIQEVLRKYNANLTETERIEVRVAINVGEVQVKGLDVLGEPVNIAARLEGITEAGEVYFTESVYLSMKRGEVPTAEVGERTFKGIPYPIRVYRVVWDPKSPQLRALVRHVQLTTNGPIIRGGARKIVLGVITALTLLIASSFLIFQASKTPEVQLALLIDTSSGSGGLIRQTQDGFGAIAKEIAEAKKAGRDTAVQLALYEYGNNRLDMSSLFIRLLSPFTSDLIQFSKVLSILQASRKRGGDEYCGAVIEKALQELKWERRASVHRAIFLVGNESIAQGPVPFQSSVRKAVADGVTVNTVYYGPRQDGIAAGWEEAAQLGHGVYYNIDPDDIGPAGTVDKVIADAIRSAIADASPH